MAKLINFHENKDKEGIKINILIIFKSHCHFSIIIAA